MTKQRESQLATELMRARIRLGMIARMATMGKDEQREKSEIVELMQTIIATTGLEEVSG